MQLHGRNLIGFRQSARGVKTFRGRDPKSHQDLEPAFHEAMFEDVDEAVELAASAFEVLSRKEADEVAGLLDAIADAIVAVGDVLIDTAVSESGLGKDRLTGERARTVNQLKMFAALVRDGSYLDARIDTALPDRKPLPRPDLRRMLIPVGPVAVFAASNFPLAFSVAGGDTASALAARNPVVLKAHPAHPATSELVGTAIIRAVEKCGMPEGTFSLLHATDPQVSLALVKHPDTKAVGFTGSLRAGRAIFDAAAQRPEPIPAFVEMGSINPVFVLDGALARAGDGLAAGLFGSINLGVGQFCTNPGVVVARQGAELEKLTDQLSALFRQGAPGTMLYGKIREGYEMSVKHMTDAKGVAAVASDEKASLERTEVFPVLFRTDSRTWLSNGALHEEVFGPASMVVQCEGEGDLLEIARSLPGTLTATIHGTPEDLERRRDLIRVLETKAGRILFNGFPTGVEVSPAMHHGGPYPATADAKFTSVGTAAILRFLRPICYQNFPQPALPEELRDENSRGMWRAVNGSLTRDPVKS